MLGPRCPSTEAMLTMRPPLPAAIMSRPARRAQRNWPVRLTEMTLFQSCRENSLAGRMTLMPALFTRMSTGPNVARTLSNARSTASSSAMSAAMRSSPLPGCRPSASTARSRTATLAPAPDRAPASAPPSWRVLVTAGAVIPHQNVPLDGAHDDLHQDAHQADGDHAHENHVREQKVPS